jgi:FtsH-binding integral membrane protein
MALDPRTQVVTPAGARAGDIDEGLRTYMLRVYNYMSLGLVVTGMVAYFVAHTPAVREIIFGNQIVYWVVLLAPLGLLFFVFKPTMSASAAQMTYWAFCVLLGMSLASIFFVYTQGSITRVFFITSATFAGMSLYGYTTKRDLSGIGSFLIMGLWGQIVAMVVNFFTQSAALDWAISVIGVLIFVGLTAYDTQMIRKSYNEADGSEIATTKAVFGALRLYLDFLNLFLFLLRLFGNRN